MSLEQHDKAISDLSVKVNKLDSELSSQKGDIKVLLATSSDIKEHMVRKEEFAPVKTSVYGLIGLITTIFITAIAALVWRGMP